MSSNDWPQTWCASEVGDVAVGLIAGSAFPKEHQGLRSENHPFAKVGDISRIYRSGNRVIDEAEHSISESTRAALRARLFPKGTIVFPKIGEALRGNYRLITGRPMLFDNNVMGITPAEHIIDVKFLYYFLTTQDFGRFAVATAVPSVRTGDIASIPLGVPPLVEQRRIVAKIEELFSELDKGVESLATAREQLKTYRQALLKHAFEGKLTADWRAKNPDTIEMPPCGTASDETALPSDNELSKLPVLPKPWHYVKLSAIARIGSGMSVSKNREFENPIEVPYLRVANVQRGRLDLTHITSMKVERHQLPELVLRKWDVLFNEGGDRDKLGRGWIWEEQISPCITQNHVFRASLHHATESQAKFLSYWGNTYGQEYFNTEGKQTTNLASINRTTLASFPVPLVSPHEQKEIVGLLESQLTMTKSLASEIELSLARCFALRQSILKQAFSGRLVPQDPNDEPASVLLECIRTERTQAALAPKPKRPAKKRLQEVSV